MVGGKLVLVAQLVARWRSELRDPGSNPGPAMFVSSSEHANLVTSWRRLTAGGEDAVVL